MFLPAHIENLINNMNITMRSYCNVPHYMKPQNLLLTCICLANWLPE